MMHKKTLLDKPYLVSLLLLLITILLLDVPISHQWGKERDYTNNKTKSWLCNMNKQAFRRDIGSWAQPERRRILYITSMLITSTNVSTPRKVPLFPGESVGTGNYLIQVDLGTPPKPHFWVVDTGSDLAWTQCLPCTSCANMNTSTFYNPSFSETYVPTNCGTADCRILGPDFTAPCTSATFCHYVIRYADGSVTTGDFARETLSIGGTLVSRSYPIGCAHTNTGITLAGMDGLIGFSMGTLAFPRQTNSSAFSYCMASPFADVDDGYIMLSSTTVPTNRSSCTPLSRALGGSFYVVRIANVSVAGRRFGPSSLAIVDSGTIITRLATSLYYPVLDAFRNATAGSVRVPDPSGEDFFDTCFLRGPENKNISLPSVTFVFAGGTSFTPSPLSLLFPLTDQVSCFAFLPIEATYSILGNFQQQSYEFTFDIARSRLCIGNTPSC